MSPGEYIDRITRFLTEHPWWVAAIDWTKTHSLPGFGRIPIYNLILFINLETQDDAIVTRANSMAFSYFLAIFPSIIVLFTLLAYTPLYETFDVVLNDAINRVMPGQAGEMLFKTVQDV